MSWTRSFAKFSGPRIAMLAEAVLTAVSEGRAESVALAQELAEAVLGQEEVQRAAGLRRLLGENSPFALVRAVELAELLRAGIEARSRKVGR